jgi:hypothetical protein
MSVPTLKRLERSHTFPEAVVISERAVGYRTTEILAWAASREPSGARNKGATAAASAALAAKRAAEKKREAA